MGLKKRKWVLPIIAIIAVVVCWVWVAPFASVQWHIHKLYHEDEKVKEKAAEALAKIGKPAVPALIRVLEDDNDGIYDPELLRAASNALALIGKDAKEAIPVLIHSDAPEVPTASIVAGFGPDAIPYCIAALGSDDSYEQESAAKALIQMGDDAIPSVLEALSTGNWRTRIKSAEIFERLAYEGNPVNEAVKPLTNMLDDTYHKVRLAGICALQEYGGDEEGLVPALLAASNDGHEEVRRYAVYALGEMGPRPGVVDTLIQRLSDSNAWVRQGALRALGKMGPDPKAVSALIEVLGSDADNSERAIAAESLGEIGAEPRILEALTNAMDDKWSNVRESAERALRKLD